MIDGTVVRAHQHNAVGEAIGVTHQTVQRRLDRAVWVWRDGVMAALDDSPRPGKGPTIPQGISAGETTAPAWLSPRPVPSSPCRPPRRRRPPPQA
jgi:hypothetical protein